MSEPTLYWGVDEYGIPYPLTSIEAWWQFFEAHPDRIDIGRETWQALTGEEIEISTKFFGTDLSAPGYDGRCMFETATFVDEKLWAMTRMETREQAELTHRLTIEAMHLHFKPVQEQS